MCLNKYKRKFIKIFSIQQIYFFYQCFILVHLFLTVKIYIEHEDKSLGLYQYKHILCKILVFWF